MKQLENKAMPREDISGRKPLVISFPVESQMVRRIAFPPQDARRKEVLMYELAPSLAHYFGRTLPDGVNPRSHEDDCLRSQVARDIEKTINESPEDFPLASRGITIVADHFEYDPKRRVGTITLTDYENHGIADGGTTDAVIAHVQAKKAKDTKFSLLPEEDRIRLLGACRVPLHVFVGLDDRDRIGNLVKGRNTSVQVRPWSLADFSGKFDWIKDILDTEGSPVRGRIGYEENARKTVSVLDVLALMTLFHPIWDVEGDEVEVRAPTMAYGAKGRMDSFLSREEMTAGYLGLAPVLLDILDLHDYVYAGFEEHYAKAAGSKGAKLGRRNGVDSRLGQEPLQLPFSSRTSNYEISNGYIYPLLAAFRACLRFTSRGNNEGKAHWKHDPKAFYDAHGSKLIRALIEHIDDLGGFNMAAKKKPLYLAVHQKAQLLLNKGE